MFNDQGQCSALLTREGFFDFVIFKTPCNISHPVAVICQHEHKKNIAFHNNMSDIKVSMVNGYYSLQEVSIASCDSDWFLEDNMCINLYHYQLCPKNSEAHRQCSEHGGQLASHVLKNVTLITPGNRLDDNLGIALFFKMFYHAEDVKLNNYKWRDPDDVTVLAVNASALCVAYDMSHECQDNDISLIVHYYDEVIYDGFQQDSPSSSYSWEWSVIDHVSFLMANYRHFTLCEKSFY